MPGFADLLRRPRIPIAASISSHRILLYSVVSLLAVSAAIANALKNHSNFYSVAIYLSRSNRSVLVLANFGLLIALLCGRVFQQIFFGPLRPAEVERLYDRLWFFVTESLLAFTIFRDDFDIPFALMFGFLLFVKSFHWLASDRIEWMDQRPYPGPPTLFHVRMNSLLLLLWSIDFMMFAFAVESTLSNGVSGMVLFASEYAILMASAINTGAKYILSVIELRRAARRGGESAPPWENKSMWVFYIELSTDFLKLTTYLVFFTLIITFYGLPLNIVRDVFVTARSFITRLRALQRYRTATRNMDERYPDATEAEMTAMSDRTCIICREEMILRGTPPGAGQDASQPAQALDGPNTTPKKLPCGHIFHFHCLRSWLERQQSCPTCRRTVLDATPQGEAATARPAGGAQAPNAQGGQAAPRVNNGANVPHVGAPGQIPLPGNIPGWGQPGGPNGVLIQYNIQYQIGRPGQQPLPAPPPPPPPMLQPPVQLQPAPLHNGFMGPGGVWQPWEVDPRWFGVVPVQNQAQPAEPVNPTPTATVPTPTVPVPTPPTTDTTPTPTTTIPIPTTASPLPTPTTNPPSPTVEGTSDSTSSPLPTPREAAALAALKRFGSSSSTPTRTAAAGTRSPEGTETSTSARRVSSDSSEFSLDSSSELDTSVPPSAPNGAPLIVEPPVKAPLVIPLYEFHRPNENGSPAGSSSMRTPRSPRQTQSPYFRAPAPRTRGQSQGPNVAHGNHAAPQGHYLNAQRPLMMQQRAITSRPPISQLPPTLTEAQLALMDRVTREAIDERLRVLEGVSGAVFRCIEDLMRVRSSLPASSTPTSPASASTSTSSQTGIISAAGESLDEAIAGAREAAESGYNKAVEESLAQPLVVEPSRPEASTSTSAAPSTSEVQQPVL